MQLLNKILLFGFPFLVIGLKAFGQVNSIGKNQLDTIFLSTDVMTVVLMDEPITFYNVGSTDFGFEHASNKFILYAKNNQATVSSLFLESSDGVYQALLAYQEAPSKLLYDFRVNPKIIGIQDAMEKVNPKSISTKDSEGFKAITQDSIQSEITLGIPAKLNLVLQDKQRYRSLGTKENNLLLLVSSIRVDNEAIYLKLVMENQSAMDYEIDLVTFEIESRQKGFGPGGENTRAMEILEKQQPETVDKSGFASMLYALPSFAGGNGEQLKITIREKKGSRTMSVSVPFQIIRKAKPL